MVLDIIKKDIEDYKKRIVSAGYTELYKWEALRNFQNNWNIEAADFKTMYDQSFNSKYTSNLWANPHWFPKSVMLRFIEQDKERIRQMFRDLYNVESEIENRIDHFIYNCDRILEEVYAKDSSVKNHFHDGQRIVSLYLAFRYPEQYAIYKYTEFKTFMEHVKAKDIPRTGEYKRFFTVVKTLYNILKKDEELFKIHRKLLKRDCFKGETLMLAQDFIFITARRYMN